MEAVSRSAGALQQIMPLDFSYGSFAAYPFRTSANHCPLCPPKATRYRTRRHFAFVLHMFIHYPLRLDQVT